MEKNENIPYKDYSWKEHCYRTLKKPCSPSAASEHLAILDLIKEHEERNRVLDKIRAEIEEIYYEINTVSHNEYENAVEQGKERAYENVLDIIDKYKAEMEE